MSIIGSIRSYLWVRKQKKIDPLRYSRILKEKGRTYGSLFIYFPIDKHMFIRSCVTDSGIQKCGLYFKILRFEDDEEYLGEGKVIDLCRISMQEPKYIVGFDETFKLDELQKESLITNLSKKMGNSNVTLWEYMFETMNDGRDYTKEFPELEPFKMPDYSKLN